MNNLRNQSSINNHLLNNQVRNYKLKVNNQLSNRLVKWRQVNKCLVGKNLHQSNLQ
jgi:hypothetical protein